MKRRYRRGLVVGKFAPLHRGHELVIERAFEECEEVVLISYSRPELPGCEPERRERWLATRFPSAIRLVLTDNGLRRLAAERGLTGSACPTVPENGAPDLVHRRFVAWVIEEILGEPVEAVFSSEDYGDGFAAELTRSLGLKWPQAAPVVHHSVDRGRARVPISGTSLRRDPHAGRQWLSPAVYASFVKRVVILGGESSGKSTLAEELARRYGTEFVPEYGRTLWEERQGRLAFDDLLFIGRTQIAREEEAALSAVRFLFCDTSPLTTLFYCRHLFGASAPELEELAERRYDLTVLCAPDFPFVQDGTRQEAPFRDLQHSWYLRELGLRGAKQIQVTGSVAERVERVSRALELEG